jgi:hypothetical protein
LYEASPEVPRYLCKTNIFETGATVPLEVWSVVESSMYLTAACLPLLRPVAEKVIPRKWKVVFSFPGSSRYNRSDNSEHNISGRARPSMATKLSTYDENQDSLEMGCKVTFVNEVNGRSASETSLVYPEGIEVTHEISVSVQDTTPKIEVNDF